MNFHVLGCSGAIAAGCKTTAFLVDDDVLIDAGTGVGDLALDALARIEHILISHSHLDHVLAIGLLADSVMRLRRAQNRGPIQVHALPETLAALRAHIFNGVIWPDFTRLPSAEAPVLELVPFSVGDTLTLNKKRIEVLSASHTVPAVGFAVDRSVKLAEIAQHGHVLTPGRYVGAEAVEDNDADFATKMQVLTEKLGEQMAKGAELDQVIRQKLGGLGYEF